MEIDLRRFPYSTFGSYLALQLVGDKEIRPSGSFLDFARPQVAGEKEPGLYVNSVHGESRRQDLFHMTLLKDGDVVDFSARAGVEKVDLTGEGCSGVICLVSPGGLRFHGDSAGLRLTMLTGVFDHAVPVGQDRWEINSFSNRMRYMLYCTEGSVLMDAPWSAQQKRSAQIIADLLPDPSSLVCEAVLEEFRTAWQGISLLGNTIESADRLRDDFDSFLSGIPETPEDYENTRKLAAYLNWSSVVSPAGHLQRPAMFMSKGIMSNLWSWDNCFNACAMVYGHPSFAWDQLMIPIDHQDMSGSLPDSVNDTDIVWNYCKPPVQGWALNRMMKRTKWINRYLLADIYPKLCLWTDWWFEYRDDDDDGIPQYNHGNDSGWDNATVFDEGGPVESPDLSAYLVLMMDCLSEIAGLLGRRDQSDSWRSRSDELLKKLLAHSWRSDHFVSPRSGDHHVADGDSLINYVPIILGKRLPEDVFQSLVAGLKQPDRFLTPHGLATESTKSPYYEADGYWRGPIWAPPMMFVIDGLVDIGEDQLACELSKSFCDMISKSGFAENFDALTGKGLRDPAYTWTSSVFLILAHELLTNQ